jgi:hypothetical protein
MMREAVEQRGGDLGITKHGMLPLFLIGRYAK